MNPPRFIQAHFLTSYPAALLNRDDVGFAKRIPFGGATRTRISSQCLKRHWRTFTGDHSLGAIPDTQMSVRSRRTFDQFVFQPLVEQGIDPEKAREVTAALMALVLGESPKAKKDKGSEEVPALATGQVTVLGRPELEFLAREAGALCAAAGAGKIADAVKRHFTKERKENLRALRVGAGLDAALFGRMVTSDILARLDAALHVAHSFTVHAEHAETDYFSAVDDLLQLADESALGSGHIGTTELTSGLFYGYVVVDLPLLQENLAGDSELAASVIERFLHLVATVSPGAKLGSTAPHAYAQAVLVEVGSAQPRTLANAFLKPVAERPDLLVNAYSALRSHVEGLDSMYGGPERRFASVGDAPDLDAIAERAGSLGSLAQWTAGQVRSGS